MENTIVKQTRALGSIKNIVGTENADLVLLSLGKIYIKTGKNARILNDIFTYMDKLNKLDLDNLKSLILFTEDLEKLDYPGEGHLIFDTFNNSLYISYLGSYLLVINQLDFVDSEGFVKKSGDTMKGTLSLLNKVPLIITSKTLIENLNALYINGYSSEDIAIKFINEIISGKWSFMLDTVFNKDIKVGQNAFIDGLATISKNLYVKKDIILDGSIGSSYFSSGFNGYGWRFDSNTNMLTVDYLVVRKAMQVFELIVNQVTATNGALWITDSFKVADVKQITFFDCKDSSFNPSQDVWYCPINDGYNVDERIIPNKNILNSLGNFPPKDFSTIFLNFKYIFRIKDIVTFNEFFLGKSYESVFNNYKSLKTDLDKTIQIIEMFENHVNDFNELYEIDTTPKMYAIFPDLISNNKHKEYFTSRSEITSVYLYYKYFAYNKKKYPILYKNYLKSSLNRYFVDGIYIISTEDDKLPTFKEGDIVRCQKFLDNCIKYYDALIGTKFGKNSYVIHLVDSVFDKSTEVKYNENGLLISYEEKYNTSLYLKTINKTNFFDSYYSDPESYIINNPKEIMLTTVSKDDSLVRIGNIEDTNRQNSVYITSSEFNSPYISTLSGVNRPDYSVMYQEPVWKKRTVSYKETLLEVYYKTITEEEYLSKKDISDLYKYDEKTNEYFKIYHKISLDCDIETTPVKELIEGKEIEVLRFKVSPKNTTRVRIGNLNGLYDDKLDDKQPHGYGLYGENVYLTGEFILNNGQSVVEFTKDAINMEISGMVTTNYALNSKGPMYINYVDPNDSLTTKDISETRNYLILDFIIPALNKTEMTVSWKLNPDNIILDVYYINISEPILRDKKGFIHFDSDQIISFKNKGQQIVRDKPMILLNNYNAILFMKKEFEAGGTISEIMVQKGNHKTPWEPAQMDKVASSFKMDENGILLLGKEILLKGKIRFEFFELKFKDKLQLFDVDVANMPNGTTINGGLISTGILAAGTLDKENNQYVVTSGISGILNSNKPEESISYWAGGPPVDITKDPKYNETDPDKNKKIENVASALIRMDGTGYFAKGNLSWNKDGTLNLVSDTITINGLDTLAVWVKAMLDKKILVANNISDAVEENVLYIYLSPTNNDL